ncbi:MAG: TylF/MycF/NovP-related O-methyltransferase [bacterium]
MIRSLLSSTPLRNFMLGSYLSARFFRWGSSKYLKTYSTLDARYFRWLYLLEQTKELKGDVVELGVGPGRFLAYCSSWLEINGTSKRYYGYDSFEGFPSVSEEDKVNLSSERLKRVRPGNYAFSKSRIERLIKKLRLKNIVLTKGDFSNSLRKVRPDAISFLYMDCDLYEGYKIGLEMLYEYVVPGGVILFDEYELVNEWPGAKRAVDEFFHDKIEKPMELPFSTSYFVVRGREAHMKAESR